MAFIRSRVMVALIGLIIIGGASAAAAVATAPQPTRTALVLSGQTSVGHVATNVPTATATTRVVPVATPTHASTSVTTPPAGELVDLQGRVFSTDTNASTFVVSTRDSRVTVIVTRTTTFQGRASNLSALRAGWYVQVKGTTQANNTFLATNVEASSDN